MSIETSQAYFQLRSEGMRRQDGIFHAFHQNMSKWTQWPLNPFPTWHYISPNPFFCYTSVYMSHHLSICRIPLKDLPPSNVFVASVLLYVTLQLRYRVQCQLKIAYRVFSIFYVSGAHLWDILATSLLIRQFRKKHENKKVELSVKLCHFLDWKKH